MNYIIEPMNASDWEQVEKIYYAGIMTGLATFQTQSPSWEDWDCGHLSNCRFVARYNHEVIGWVALSPSSSRCCYAGVAEVSIYISEQYKGMGVGTALLNQAIICSEENGIWTISSGIIEENEGSLALHKKCGFREIGRREKIAKMPNGVWHDVILMERRSTVVGLD